MSLRSFALAALLFMLALPAQAQWSLSAGIGGAFPNGNTGNITTGGVAFTLQAQYELASVKGLSLGGQLGIGALGTRKDNFKGALDESRLNIVPLLFTAEYAFHDLPIEPYLGLGLGPAFVSFKYYDNQRRSYSTASTEFAAAPIMGMRYWVNDRLGLDLRLGIYVMGGNGTLYGNDTSYGYTDLTFGVKVKL